jgi:hypothetical protein
MICVGMEFWNACRSEDLGGSGGCGGLEVVEVWRLWTSWRQGDLEPRSRGKR